MTQKHDNSTNRQGSPQQGQSDQNLREGFSDGMRPTGDKTYGQDGELIRDDGGGGSSRSG